MAKVFVLLMASLLAVSLAGVCWKDLGFGEHVKHTQDKTKEDCSCGKCYKAKYTVLGESAVAWGCSCELCKVFGQEFKAKYGLFDADYLCCQGDLCNGTAFYKGTSIITAIVLMIFSFY